jgi:hypothetical protein
VISKKIILYTSIAIAVAVPIVPDKYKIAINVDRAEQTGNKREQKRTEVVKTTCELEADFITSNNIHVCRYKCKEGGSISITSINRSNNCQQSIKADVKISKKNAI